MLLFSTDLYFFCVFCYFYICLHNRERLTLFLYLNKHSFIHSLFFVISMYVKMSHAYTGSELLHNRDAVSSYIIHLTECFLIVTVIIMIFISFYSLIFMSLNNKLWVPFLLIFHIYLWFYIYIYIFIYIFSICTAGFLNITFSEFISII